MRMAERVSDNIDIILEKKKKLESLFFDYLQNAYCTAFDQDDLMNLVDEGLSVIYLYGDEFTIPPDRENISYVGILKKPRIFCMASSRSELTQKNIFVSNATLCLCYESFISDILKDRAVWNIGNIKEPSAETKEDAVQRLCGIDCESVRYLELDAPGTFGMAFTEDSFVLMIEGNVRQFFYDEIEKVDKWKKGRRFLQIYLNDGTIYKNTLPQQMRLSARKMIALLRVFVEAAKDDMDELD